MSSRSRKKKGRRNRSGGRRNQGSRRQPTRRSNPTPSRNSNRRLGGLRISPYRDETEIAPIKKLMDLDLSEPYSIYTYRYFVCNWPDLTLVVYDQERIVGSVICKIEEKPFKPKRGYIAMLVVDRAYRKRGLGSELVVRVIDIMAKRHQVVEVVLETEVINYGALRLYENLGFLRVKRLSRYYLSGGDAVRLKLLLNATTSGGTSQVQTRGGRSGGG